MQQKEILVITSYPQKGTVHDKKTVGVASYTKNLLLSLLKVEPAWKVNVFAETFDKHIEQYTEESINVHRFWKRGSIRSLFSLIKEVISHPARVIVLSFEAYMFGSLINSLIVLVGLLVAKITGKKIVILQHQVAKNFSSFGKSSLMTLIMNAASAPFYWFISTVASKLVVFEEDLKTQNTNKVEVLPHLVPKVKKVSKSEAREKLGWEQNKFYALYFGYITPYKGTKWLAKVWPTTINDQLIIGGDINPNHVNDKTITAYVNSVKSIAANKKNLETKGFIPEEEISFYFSAVDALILPYHVFMSSSGPLSLAFAYELPVLLSEKLSPYINSQDIKKALKESKLTASDILFSFSQKGIQDGIENAKNKKESFIKFSKMMSQARSEENIGRIFSNILQNQL